MSVKDPNYSRQCVICGDRLPGTDDGLLVYESLKEQVEAIDDGFKSPSDCACGCTHPKDAEPFDTPSCDLCGKDCPLDEARAIVTKGPPTLCRERHR